MNRVLSNVSGILYGIAAEIEENPKLSAAIGITLCVIALLLGLFGIAGTPMTGTLFVIGAALIAWACRSLAEH